MTYEYYRLVPVEKEAADAECDHGVRFDQEAARTMTALGVRTYFPRLDGECPKGCGYKGIAYASTAHYVFGDW